MARPAGLANWFDLLQPAKYAKMFKTISRLILMTALVVSAGALAGGEQMNSVIEGSKAAKLDACVAPTALMRREHFKFIEHQRDITVHQGIRDTDHSLSGCVDCHVATDVHGKYMPIDGLNPETNEKQFCAGCHEYSGVQLDCFSCHTNVPISTGK